METDNCVSRDGRRIYWLDAARVLAILSITLNHAISRTFSVYENTALEFETLPLYLSVIKAVCYIFSRIGVPLFLMISGALLLKKDFSSDDKVKHFLRHNWLSLLITTEIWLTIMYWYLSLGASSPLRTEGIGAALLNFVSTLLFTNQLTMGSMWYMPMILCIYLLIPVVALAVSKYEEKLVLLPVTFVLVGGMVIPNLNATLMLTGSEFRLLYELDDSYLFSIYLAYVILGYYISKGAMAKLPKAVVVFGAAVSFAFTCGYQLWAYVAEADYAVMYNFVGILLCAIFLFEWIRRGKEPSERVRRPITKLSQMAFGIYFVHICIMTGMDFVFERVSVGHLPQLILLEVVSFVGSVVVITILARVKVFKKYLFMIKG